MTHETHVAAVPAGTEGGTAGKGPLDPQGGISASAAPRAALLDRHKGPFDLEATLIRPSSTTEAQVPPMTDAPQPRPRRDHVSLS
jgi:hypothetical protein